MKLAAITVRQPHAGMILDGTKIIENRSWQTLYRGPLLIHSGLRVESGSRHMPRGALGLARLVGVHSVEDCINCSDALGAAYLHASYRYHLMLSDPYRLAEPIAARGRECLWYPDPDLARAVRKASLGWNGWLDTSLVP